MAGTTAPHRPSPSGRDLGLPPAPRPLRRPVRRVSMGRQYPRCATNQRIRTARVGRAHQRGAASLRRCSATALPIHCSGVAARTEEVDKVAFTPVPVRHSVPTFGLRLSHHGTTLAYSGDSGSFDGLRKLADGADVFLCEAGAIHPGQPFHCTPKMPPTRRRVLTAWSSRTWRQGSTRQTPLAEPAVLMWSRRYRCSTSICLDEPQRRR
jgi:hypothetical protein